MILRPLGRLALHGAVFLSFVDSNNLHAASMDGIGICLSGSRKGASDFLKLFLPRAGDNLNHIAAEGGGDLDLEAMLHGSRDVDSLPCGNVVLTIEGIREEQDLRAVDLMIDDSDVAVMS